MFGFKGGESVETVARKKTYMRDAQERWHFLTDYDPSTIKKEIVLGSIFRDRSGISQVQVSDDVRAWMQAEQL